ELQREEDEAARKVGQRLAGVTEELGAVGILRIADILQVGIGAEPACEVAQCLHPLDGGAQPAIPRQVVQLASIVRLEGFRITARLLEVGPQFLRIATRIKIAEVPDRQRPQRGLVMLLRGVLGGRLIVHAAGSRSLDWRRTIASVTGHAKATGARTAGAPV